MTENEIDTRREQKRSEQARFCLSQRLKPQHPHHVKVSPRGRKEEEGGGEYLNICLNRTKTETNRQFLFFFEPTHKTVINRISEYHSFGSEYIRNYSLVQHTVNVSQEREWSAR